MRIFLLVLLCLVTAARTSQAQVRDEKRDSSSPGTQDVTQRALQLGHSGLESFEAGDWKSAGILFERAERLVHSPVFLTYQARSALHVGKWLRAEALLRKCVVQALDEDSPESWKEAVRLARVLLAHLETQLPRLRLSVGTDWEMPVTVNVNERKFVLAERVPFEVPLDPGEGVVAAVDQGGLEIQRSYRTRPGAVVGMTLGASRPLGTEPSRQDAANREPSASSSRLSPFVRGAVAAFASSGIGLSFGLTTFAVAWGTARSIKSRCSSEGVCPLSERERVNRAVRTANLATAGFVAATVGAATGVTLLILDRPNRGSGLSLRFSPSSVTLSGRF